VVNSTGGTLPIFSVVELTDTLESLTSDYLTISSRPAVEGISPTATTAPFAILLDGVANGGLVRAVIGGCAIVDIDITDSSHEYATPKVSTTANLTSAASGPVRILERESGSSGVKRACVLVSQPQNNVAALANGTHDSECDKRMIDAWSDDQATPSSIGPLAAGTYLFNSSISGVLYLSSSSDDGSQAAIFGRYDRRNTGGPNEVQTLTFDAPPTAGNLTLMVCSPAGAFLTTGNIAWNANLAAINAELDTTTGVVGGIVATGGSLATTLTLTYSGTGYAGRSYELVSVTTYPTGSTSATVARTTTGGHIQTYGDFLIVQGTWNATLAVQAATEQRWNGSASMTAIITADQGDTVHLQFKTINTDGYISPLVADIASADVPDGVGVGGVARTTWHRLY
jgi:hypothetical protein